MKWVASPATGVPQRIEFYVDGVLGTTELNSPYQFNGDPAGVLNTLTLTNGPHALELRAVMPGGVVHSRIIKVTVAN